MTFSAVIPSTKEGGKDRPDEILWDSWGPFLDNVDYFVRRFHEREKRKIREAEEAKVHAAESVIAVRKSRWDIYREVSRIPDRPDMSEEMRAAISVAKERTTQEPKDMTPAEYDAWLKWVRVERHYQDEKVFAFRNKLVNRMSGWRIVLEGPDDGRMRLSVTKQERKELFKEIDKMLDDATAAGCRRDMPTLETLTKKFRVIDAYLEERYVEKNDTVQVSIEELLNEEGGPDDF